MQYMCTSGHYKRTMYLEDGLEEGPPDQIPVPMFVGACIDCGSTIGHVQWDLDHEVDLDELPEDAPYFMFPSRKERRRMGEQACGRPMNRPPEWLGSLR